MKVQPVGRSLLVCVRKKKSKHGLLLPEDHSDPQHAQVIGVGEKVEMPVKEGDMVLVSPYAGMKGVGGDDEAPYLLIAEKEVLGILIE